MAHLLYGLPISGYTLTDVKIEEDNNLLLSFSGNYDTREISVTVDSPKDQKKIAKGIKKLSNMTGMLEDGIYEVNDTDDFYISKMYDIDRDITYHKVCHRNDIQDVAEGQGMLACVPVPDSLYIEAQIAEVVTKNINNQFFYDLSISATYQ